MLHPPRNPSPPGFRRALQALLGLAALSFLSVRAQNATSPAPAGHGSYIKVHAELNSMQTADHSKFKILQGPFKDGDGAAVTKACLTCHTEAAKQVMATQHWLWHVPQKGLESYGKATDLVNNFCISIRGGNTATCTRCHAGYGFQDKNFDFTNPDNVDCLVCHDTTGDYEKETAGYPNPAIDLAEVAQHVGRPTLKNCGACHFFGGGADATKHGDLDDTILNAPRNEDVHMSKQGAGMTCIDCHVSTAHQIGGPDYVLPANMREKPKYPGEAVSRMSCTACHSATPHKSYILNRHYQKVACQTCHIPEFARDKRGTNLWWDWSTAGKLKNGRPYTTEDKNGFETYNSMHGDLVWARDVVPQYVWYDGNMKFTRLTDTITPPKDPNGSIMLNPVEGSYTDPNAKIWPFKFHEGKQPYDTVLNKLIAPYTAGPAGSGAFWGDWKWEPAIEKGMATAGLPYSGHYGFVRTTMEWPITHMVAPKEMALTCTACHAQHGRLAKVPGFYLLGRDRGTGLDAIGFGVILLTIVGVAVHGILRFIHGRH